MANQQFVPPLHPPREPNADEQPEGRLEDALRHWHITSVTTDAKRAVVTEEAGVQPAQFSYPEPVAGAERPEPWLTPQYIPLPSRQQVAANIHSEPPKVKQPDYSNSIRVKIARAAITLTRVGKKAVAGIHNMRQRNG